MFDDFFEVAAALKAEGEPFATALVVRAERPTSGKPGDRAIIQRDGTVLGWIGGSCAHPTVVREAAAAIADGRARLVRISPDPEAEAAQLGVRAVAMTCFSGGTLDVFIEPQLPAPRLLVVGSLPVARSLVELGRALGYETVAVDPSGGGEMDHADVVVREIDAIGEHVSPLTFAVVTTHGDHDEPALLQILESPAPYVGLVASHKRGAAVLEVLEQDGVDAAARARVRFPAGLDLGAKRGDEIALSILAEIVQTLRGMEGIAWDEGAAPGAPVATDAPAAFLEAEATDEPAAPSSDPATAVDPICHMTVQVAGAHHTHEHEGETYYFCCGGCRARFAADPHAYAGAGTG